jgi:IclR family acetate operon transcriptional repressor
VQSVGRALRLLQILAHGGGQLALSDVAAEAGLPVATTHRLLQSLADSGFVCRTDSRRYGLGPSLIGLGRQAQAVFIEWAEPVLLSIVDKVQETACLSVLDNDEVLYIAQIQSQQTMRVVRDPGTTRAGLHYTSAGKAILAQLPDDRVREIIGRSGLPPRTPSTVRTVDALLEQVRLTRDRGWAMDDQEAEIGIRCVGVPAGGGLATTAISVSGPAARMTDTKCEEIVRLLTSMAGTLTGPVPGGAGPI